jgi:hypothetical protein
MGKGACNFREADVRRAVRAVTSAGQKVAAVFVDGSRITIKVKDGDDVVLDNDGTNIADDNNPWDQVDK